MVFSSKSVNLGKGRFPSQPPSSERRGARGHSFIWYLRRDPETSLSFDTFPINFLPVLAATSTFSAERVFSAAGKMHDDLRKSEKDNTLEHSLFAAYNVE